MVDNLKKLQSWYSSVCDGEWEHSYGISIETLDNPGWSVDIDLKGTFMAGKSFNSLFEDRTEDNWIRCEVIGNRFEGRGGVENLEEILSVFNDWIEKSK